MTWEIVTPAASLELVDRATVKSRLGITDTSEDALLDAWIELTNELLPQELGRQLVRQVYVETLQGDGETQNVHLAQFPIDPTTLTITVDGTSYTDHTVPSRRIGEVAHKTAWPASLDSVFTYAAGYLRPADVSDWEASTAKTSGQWVRPTSAISSSLRFECTTAGTTDATEPDWSSVAAGGTVTDNGVTWTARRVEELPKIWRDSAYLLIRHWYETHDRDESVASWSSDGGFSESYRSEVVDFPRSVQRVVDAWRYAA